MPKNKGKYRSQQPKAPDPVLEVESLTSRAFQYVRPHMTKVVAVLVGLSVVLLMGEGWLWWKHKKEAEATKLFGQATETLHASLAADEPPPDPAKPAPKDAPKKYKSAKERSEAALVPLVKLESDYGSTGVAEQARLVRAGVLYDLERFDDAGAAYKKYLESSPDGDLVLIAREGLGQALEAKALSQKDAAARDAGLKEALKAYEQVQPDEKGFQRDQALYDQARVKALLGDKPGATALYKQILEKDPATPLRAEINGRLALLE